jgi:hypothetical protein
VLATRRWQRTRGEVADPYDPTYRTLPLTKNADGKLTATLPIPYGKKISFKVRRRRRWVALKSKVLGADELVSANKYVVDGAWVHNPTEPHEADESGNMNNVFTGEPVDIFDVPLRLRELGS